MGITGKYNFPGIQKAGIAAIKAILASTTWGVALLASPFFAPFEDVILSWTINWLANRGLIVLNLGTILIEGEVDQALLDKALDEGIRRVELGRDKLSAAEGKAIDDKVIEAARRDIPGSP